MVRIEFMHAGEEALIVLVPLVIVIYLDKRKRRKQQLQAAEPNESED